MFEPGKQLSGLDAYRALLAMAFEFKPYFIAAIIGMIIFALSDASFAYLMKPMLDDGFIKRDEFIIKLIPLAIIGIFIVRMIAVYLRTYCMDYIGRQVINKLRRQVFEKLLTLTTREYDRASSGQILTKFSFDIEQVASSVSSALTVLIQDSLRIFVLLAYMLWLSWELSVIFLLVGPIVFLIVVKVSSRFRRISRNIQASMGEVSHVAQEVIDSNQVVKIFGGSDFEREKFERINQHNLKLNLKMTSAQAISMPLIQLIVAIAFAAIIAFATSEAMHGKITSGDFISFIFALTSLFAPMRSLSSINAKIQRGIAAGESVFGFLARDSEPDQGSKTLQRASGEMRFQHISFNYPGHEKTVINDFSLHVYPNQTIAIVGRSGSGKSTLIKLLPRLYELTEGSILVDGEDIRDYRLADLRRQIAYVGQDIRLFNDSIRNNIAYGSLGEATEQQLIDAAKQAYAWEYIEKMPQGLDTMVGEKGVLLSGGQRQRLAIARALLKDAPILILDEATSALDTESERHIQHAIDNLMSNRTTLVIAHRLSTVEHADLIIVMQDGSMVEQGTHRELLELDGVYGRLHAMQFEDSD
ncbi:MAG: lipid A export permease/ATP-binding protein MsbA [Gammaproteobacteria bacterium]|nr:lipid A export permease/ATP-binding protein MsbA [Gammaproteobacteria bacterium]